MYADQRIDTWLLSRRAVAEQPREPQGFTCLLLYETLARLQHLPSTANG